MRHSLSISLILLGALASATLHAATNDIAERAQRIENLAQRHPRPNDLAYADAMRREYATAFGDQDSAQQLGKETNEALRTHWQAVSTASFYSDDTALALATLRVFDELSRRKLANNRDIVRSFNALLKARRFDDARALTARFPDDDLPSVPSFIATDTPQPGAWKLAPNGRTAEWVDINLQPLQIIVAAGCHFSEDAARDIAEDPLLGPVFARHAHWLSPPMGSEKLDALAAWNTAHPKTPMLAIHTRSAWSLIPKWRMPTFAIVKDGRLVDSTSGWRSGDPEFRAKLVALLVRAGLLEADTP